MLITCMTRFGCSGNNTNSANFTSRNFSHKKSNAKNVFNTESINVRAFISISPLTTLSFYLLRPYTPPSFIESRLCVFVWRNINRRADMMDNDAATFPDSDDDNLLLDDENVAFGQCGVCAGVIMGNTSNSKYCRLHENTLTTGALIDTGSTINIHSDEQLDSPEDSPLLRPDQLKHFGHLSIKDFHCHSYRERVDQSQAYKTLCIVSVLCFLFMVMEIVGGYIAGSLAVMTDAAHLFSDLIGFMLSIVSIWISRKPATSTMTFGYYRAEVIGAFLSVIAVWILAVTFCILAIGRILKQEYDIEVNTMLIISGLGLVINIIMGGVLHGFCLHGHSHGGGLVDHSHKDNINIRAAAAHVIGDLLQSLGVLIAAIVIKIFPSAKIADPICTILFSVIVVIATVRVAKDSVLLLVEASPRSTGDVANMFRNIPGVKHVHSLHVWSLAPGKEAIAAHLAIDEICDRDDVLNEATFLVKRNLHAVSVTIQVEPYDQERVNTCTECQTPPSHC